MEQKALNQLTGRCGRAKFTNSNKQAHRTKAYIFLCRLVAGEWVPDTAEKKGSLRVIFLCMV